MSGSRLAHWGKGREGNRKGKDKTLTSFSTHLQSPPGPSVMLQKHCRQCDETKPLEAFYRCSRNKDGRASQCIACRKLYLASSLEIRRETMRKWRSANPAVLKRNAESAKPAIRDRALSQYGLSMADFERLLESQGGVCAICGGGQVISGRRLAVDHDHVTGAVRGLLCNRCNTGIGLLGDTASGARRAVNYLERAEAVRATPADACEMGMSA